MDLRRLIFSFGSVDHRKFTKKLSILQFDEKKHLSFYYGKELLSPVPRRAMRSRRKYSYLFPANDDMIQNLILFYKMKRCMCCSRHSYKKPDIILNKDRLAFVPYVTLFVPEEVIDHGDCECECRHTCRFVWCHLISEQIHYLPV
jgi:hypothetical protein